MRPGRSLRTAAVLPVGGAAIAAAPAAWWPPAPPPSIDIDVLGGFPFDGRAGTLADVPASLRALDGRHTTVVGYAYALPSNLGEPFQIIEAIPHNDHRPPEVQERVFATVVPGRAGEAAAAAVAAVDMYTLADFHGVLHVRVVRGPSGRVDSVFTMDVDGVTPDVPATPPRLPVWVVAVRAIGFAVIAWGLMVVAGWGIDNRRRWLAERALHCPDCGYDLRATPGRCPECGRVPQ
jgi:hypothetical protein